MISDHQGLMVLTIMYRVKYGCYSMNEHLTRRGQRFSLLIHRLYRTAQTLHTKPTKIIGGQLIQDLS